MKSSLRLSVVCLFVISLLLAGCGNDQYAIEKKYWQAQKQAEKIFKNPQGTPPLQLQRVVNRLNQFVKKYPNTNLAIDADFNIARLYIVKEEYDQARAQLNKIVDKYGKYPAICAEAVFLSGNSYQIQDKWNSALEQYKKIMQLYPTTPRGIDVPVYIAQYYKVKYQPDKMLAAYQEAIAHYKSVAEQYRNTPMSYIVSMLAAKCYVAIKDWQGAVNSLNAIIIDYKGKVDLQEALMTSALVYTKELKDKVKAKQMLEALIKDYPRGKLLKPAKELLKELDK